MVDCLDCLWHDCIVGGDDDDCEVGHLGSSGTHCREGFVARGVEEGDSLPVREFHVVGTDVLGDSSCLSCNNVGFPDVVEEGSLTVVNVSHHGDDRRSRNEIPVIVILLLLGNGLRQGGRDELNLIAEFLSNEHKCLSIKPLVDGYHQTEIHTSSDDLCHRSIVHQSREVVDSHEFRHLQNLLVECLKLHLLLHLL